MFGIQNGSHGTTASEIVPDKNTIKVSIVVARCTSRGRASSTL
jgi:hypothetical protein